MWTCNLIVSLLWYIFIMIIISANGGDGAVLTMALRPLV